MQTRIDWSINFVLVVVAVLLLLVSAGCTTASARHAISGYEVSDDAHAAAFHNAIRIADEQMYLNLIQYVRLHEGEPDKLYPAIRAAWQARRGLEGVRVQFERARFYGRVTHGQYLYDQQGFLNVVFESGSQSLDRFVAASEAGNEAAGITDWWDLVPDEIERHFGRTPRSDRSGAETPGEDRGRNDGGGSTAFERALEEMERAAGPVGAED